MTIFPEYGYKADLKSKARITDVNKTAITSGGNLKGISGQEVWGR
jgi:hypothetical protein